MSVEIFPRPVTLVPLIDSVEHQATMELPEVSYGEPDRDPYFREPQTSLLPEIRRLNTRITNLLTTIETVERRRASIFDRTIYALSDYRSIAENDTYPFNTHIPLRTLQDPQYPDLLEDWREYVYCQIKNGTLKPFHFELMLQQNDVQESERYLWDSAYSSLVAQASRLVDTPEGLKDQRVLGHMHRQFHTSNLQFRIPGEISHQSQGSDGGLHTDELVNPEVIIDFLADQDTRSLPINTS